MAYTLRKQFSTSLATTFINDIQFQRSNYYYFLGKLDSWCGGEFPPQIPQELSESEDVAIRNNAAYFKKITPNDVTLVCPRYDWISGNVYTQWDDTQELDGQPFYVVTDEQQVYKCLDNNIGQPSTIKPTGKNLRAFKTLDGYTWKYMYTIPSFKKSRFNSINFIPVQRALSDSFYNQGSVEAVSVLEGGSGYTDTQQTFITVIGTTTGSGATATFTLNAAGGIESVTVTNGGSGYSAGVRVTIPSIVGENAVLRAVVSGGIVTGVDIINPGIGYSTSLDAIEFTVGGAVLIPTISSVTGAITDVIIIDAGAGYISAPTLTVNAVTGTGAYAGNTTALLESVIDDGSIQRVLIRDPGVNYPYSSNTTIQVQGDGTGLSLSPIIYNGELIDVIVENPGYGYTNLILTVIGDGTGAAIRPIYANSDYNSDQSVVEQVAVDGAIYSIVVTEMGTGYNGTTTVTIDGDGTGASAHAVVVGNQITQIIMDDWGSGYSRAAVTISDPNRFNNFGQYVDASAYAILPPVNGHGVDAVKEMYGRTLAISSSIRSDPTLTQYNQDFRQFGIIHQPRRNISNKLSTIDFDFNVYEIIANNVAGMLADDVLVGSNGDRFRVVFFNVSSVIWLQPLQRGLRVPSDTLVSETNPANTYIVQEVVTRPRINKHSGNLMYVANEAPFEFSDTQGLLIKTYISF